MIEKFINEDQDEKSVEKLYAKIIDLITTGEEIIYFAIQKKPAITISPESIVLTNKRLFICRPKSLGFKMEFEDFYWKDILSCHIKEELFGSVFSLKTISETEISVEFIPKVQARKLYQFAQEKEEEMIEYRRQRDLESKRAENNSSFLVQNPILETQVPKNEEKDENFLALEKLKKLLDSNLISQEDYSKKKEEILSRI